MARVVIAGATGTIGRSVVRAALERGDDVVALSRSPESARETLGDGVSVHGWTDPQRAAPPEDALRGADAVVSLIGEPVAQRWSGRARREIEYSRVLGTRSLVEGIRALPAGARPATLISQSAVGFYGAHGDEPLDEQAGPGGDFLARLVVEWEREALAADSPARVVVTRTGVVLSPGSGALAKMLPPFRLGLGGPIAGGRQYVPWIHIDDVVGGLLHSLGDGELTGPVNLTAPNPVTNAELSKTLGRVLERAAVLQVPGFAMRALYGEMSLIVTTGQRVIPERLRQSGYRFRHPELEPALRDVLGREGEASRR